MGYVNDVSLAHFVSPFKCGYSAGTWTPTVDVNVISNVRTAQAADFDVYIPLELPGSEAFKQGAKITSIDVWYDVSEAALTGLSGPVLVKIALPANDDNPSGSNPTITMDTAHDTEAECLTTGDHKMTITPSTPFYLEDDYAYYISFTCTPAAGSVFSLIGAQIKYELRL